VQVQQGCDHRCTFCIIPFGRGPSRSVPVDALVAQGALVGAGYQELVLTGVDITSYGPDLPGRPTLGQLVRRLLAKESRLMPHLHLSLRAGCDLILKRMKRRHLAVDAHAASPRVAAGDCWHISVSDGLASVKPVR